MKKFEPTVIAFSCMFCAGCEPVAAKPEKSMKAAQLRVIRLHCLGKINSMHVLKAFESGADAVLVAGGCVPVYGRPGSCAETDRVYPEAS